MNVDPAKPQFVASFQAIILTAGQLYRFDLDKQPQPDLAEKPEVSADGLTVKMMLKPNLVYSDGTPVKAEDAVYALERQRTGPAPPSSRRWSRCRRPTTARWSGR